MALRAPSRAQPTTHASRHPHRERWQPLRQGPHTGAAIHHPRWRAPAVFTNDAQVGTAIHSFGYRLMLPAFDAPILPRGATLAHRTAGAGRALVGVKRLAATDAAESPDQALTGGTAIRIALWQLAEVLAAEQSLGLVARGLGFGQTSRWFEPRRCWCLPRRAAAASLHLPPCRGAAARRLIRRRTCPWPPRRLTDPVAVEERVGGCSRARRDLQLHPALQQ